MLCISCSFFKKIAINFSTEDVHYFTYDDYGQFMVYDAKEEADLVEAQAM